MNAIECDQLDSLIMENQNLIWSLSKQYDYALRDDLFQVGVIGMIDAYKHYDTTLDTKFSSYAYPYILGEMKKFVRENRSIKVGRDLIYLYSRIEKAKDVMRQQLYREPSSLELSSFLDISEDRVAEALRFNDHCRSIDEPINDEGRELTLQDVIGSYENCDKLDLINLRDELCHLDPKEREIIERRYFNDQTQAEIAAIMGLSQVDVSRTERRSILVLRNKMQ